MDGVASPPMRQGGGLRWLEISPGFACNCRCIGCHSCSPATGDQMSWPEVQSWLLKGRRGGARHIWLSGGEPTIRKDFLATLRAARAIGYERIKVQSNGMMFSYPEFTRRALDAGMNEVNLLLKSLDPKIHDGLNRTPGSFAALDRGLAQLEAAKAAGSALRLEGDILVTSRNYEELVPLVEHYAARGLSHFNLWLFSLVDQGDRDLRRLVPRISDLRPAMEAAYDRAIALGCTMVSLNTPACMITPSRWRALFDASGMDLLVVNPGGRAFMLQDSSIEQGVFVESCASCSVRATCHGMRQDYLDVHGSAELVPVPAELSAGFDPRGSALDL